MFGLAVFPHITPSIGGGGLVGSRQQRPLPSFNVDSLTFMKPEIPFCVLTLLFLFLGRFRRIRS